jgi:hypothetical protein
MSDVAAARLFRDPAQHKRGFVITYRKPILARVSIGKRKYLCRSFDDAGEAAAWAEAERARVVSQPADFVPIDRRR